MTLPYFDEDCFGLFMIFYTNWRCWSNIHREIKDLQCPFRKLIQLLDNMRNLWCNQRYWNSWSQLVASISIDTHWVQYIFISILGVFDSIKEKFCSILFRDNDLKVICSFHISSWFRYLSSSIWSMNDSTTSVWALGPWYETDLFRPWELICIIFNF